MRRFFTFALLALALAGAQSHAQTAASSASGGQPVVLDRVVAVINGDVLLESDVDEEMRFAALEPFEVNNGMDTRQDAMRRLINRALIMQQMNEQQQFDINISDADVEKSLMDLRSHLPECVKDDCATPQGWNAFLRANDLSDQEVIEYWKERMTILRFIDLRFRSGISISQESIADYYAKSVVPVFGRQHQTAPALKNVSARIQEVLLQQQVNGMLQAWLTSLRDEGSIRILDPEYAASAGNASGSKTDGEE
jgi:peptidyl-prolyl cis-trans isomerase SurA